MTKTIHINLRPYARLSNANFRLAFAAIINALEGNSHFVAPSPSISELKSSLAAFTEKAAAVEAKDFTLKPERDLIRSTMLTQLAFLSTYCHYRAAHSSNSTEEAIAKIQSAGFVVGRQGGYSKGKPLPAPENVRSKTLSRAIEIRYNAVKNATLYLIMSTKGFPSEESEWTNTFTVRTKHILNNIPAGQIITCKVYALGTLGPGQPSGFISAMAGL